MGETVKSGVSHGPVQRGKLGVSEGGKVVFLRATAPLCRSRSPAFHLLKFTQVGSVDIVALFFQTLVSLLCSSGDEHDTSFVLWSWIQWRMGKINASDAAIPIYSETAYKGKGMGMSMAGWGVEADAASAGQGIC